MADDELELDDELERDEVPDGPAVAAVIRFSDERELPELTDPGSADDELERDELELADELELEDELGILTPLVEFQAVC